MISGDGRFTVFCKDIDGEKSERLSEAKQQCQNHVMTNLAFTRNGVKRRASFFRVCFRAVAVVILSVAGKLLGCSESPVQKFAKTNNFLLK
jgi:hypothetical protein